MKTAFALFALLAATSIASADPPDLWLTPPRAADADIVWKGFDSSRVTFLPKGEDAAALKLLARHKIVALNHAAFAKVMPGTSYPQETDRKPYLVRGVEMEQSLGSIGVISHGDDLCVIYSGPIEPGEIRHRAAILSLPAPPKYLCVSISLYS